MNFFLKLHALLNRYKARVFDFVLAHLNEIYRSSLITAKGNDISVPIVSSVLLLLFQHGEGGDFEHPRVHSGRLIEEHTLEALVEDPADLDGEGIQHEHVAERIFSL